jgi:hypothetical protein
MRAEGRLGSASVSAVAVFIALLLAIGALAALSPTVSQLFSANREGLRERGERGAELVRIYVHSTDETELGQPVITIINSHDRPSILTDYVVVSRRGEVLAAGKVGGSLSGLRLEPGERVDMQPGDLGLSYARFAEMADAVKAIYFRTAEGNSFGSSYGPPPDDEARITYSFSTTRSYAIEIPSTTTSYSYSINGTFPTLGEALVVKNVILVDRNGVVRGGATNGQRWSDGSFSPSRIMLSGRLSTGPDSVPMGGYYGVPDWGTDPDGSCLDIYKRDDTCPQYIEVVEIHPREYFSPGGSATAQAYYARFAAETQVVWNQLEARTYTVTAQRPVRMVQYPYGIPGTYTMTAPMIATSTYTTRVPVTTTATYVTSTTTTTTSISSDQRSGQCTAPSGYYLSCSFTINPPSGTFVVRAIKEVGYTISGSGSSYLCSTKVGDGIQYVKVSGPWGTYTFTSTSWSTSGNFPAGSVTFELAVRHSWASMGCSATIRGWVVYELLWNVPTVRTTTVTTTYLVMRTTLGTTTYSTTTMVPVAVWAEGGLVKFAPVTGWVVYEFFWSGPTATATVLASDLGEQVRRAVNGSQLSGDAVASLAGTVHPGQVIKVNAPIILLNYVYFIKTDPRDLPPSPSPRSGGGASYGGRMWCEVTTELRPAPDGGGGPAGRIGDIDVYIPKWLEYQLVRCWPL